MDLCPIMNLIHKTIRTRHQFRYRVSLLFLYVGSKLFSRFFPVFLSFYMGDCISSFSSNATDGSVSHVKVYRPPSHLLYYSEHLPKNNVPFRDLQEEDDKENKEKENNDKENKERNTVMKALSPRFHSHKSHRRLESNYG